MKKCPYCAEEVKDEAIKCKYCQSNLTKKPGETEQKIAIYVAISGVALACIALFFTPLVKSLLALVSAQIKLWKLSLPPVFAYYLITNFNASESLANNALQILAIFFSIVGLLLIFSTIIVIKKKKHRRLSISIISVLILTYLITVIGVIGKLIYLDRYGNPVKIKGEVNEK